MYLLATFEVSYWVVTQNSRQTIATKYDSYYGVGFRVFEGSRFNRHLVIALQNMNN